MIQDMHLENVHVAHARLEELIERERINEQDSEVVAAGGFPFDALTSRATLTLPPTLELAASSVRSGGHAFLWKGSGRHEEKAKHPEWNRVWTAGPERTLEDGTIAVCNFIKDK